MKISINRGETKTDVQKLILCYDFFAKYLSLIRMKLLARQRIDHVEKYFFKNFFEKAI